MEQLQEQNHRLYEDILPEHYGESFANPDYAVKELGEGYGQILAALYTEIRGDIVYAFEMRLENVAILNEVFLEVYNLFVQAWEADQRCVLLVCQRLFRSDAAMADQRRTGSGSFFCKRYHYGK